MEQENELNTHKIFLKGQLQAGNVDNLIEF